MHPISLSCQSMHLTACQLQQHGIPKEGYELSLANAKNEEERWCKYCIRVVSHQPQSLLYQTVQSRDVKPQLLHPFPATGNLKRMEVHESTPHMRSYFGSDGL